MNGNENVLMDVGVRKRKMLRAIALFVVILCVTVALNIMVRKQDLPQDLEKTTCVVTHVKERVTNKRVVHRFYTTRDGVEYQIHNIKGVYPKEGDTIEVYYTGGEYYANVEAIRTSTPLAKVYFAMLAVAYLAIIWMMLQIAYYRQAKKMQKQG